MRNPIEVALSLQKRNGMTREQALSLWLIHALCGERDSVPRDGPSTSGRAGPWSVNGETFRLEQGSQPDVRIEEQFHAWSTSQFPGAAG